MPENLELFDQQQETPAGIIIPQVQRQTYYFCPETGRIAYRRLSVAGKEKEDHQNS